MRVKLDDIKNITITGDYIKLDAMLKYTAVASSGGEAKILIQSGKVFVGGVPCMSRGKKIRNGDVVRFGRQTFVVRNKEI